MTTRVKLCACALALGWLGQAAAAEKIYSSVDQEGNVTFSDTVPTDAVEVEQMRVTPAQPREADVEAGQQRAVDAVEAANESQRQRDAARDERQAAIEAAQQRVKAAEVNLRDAKQVREQDRQAIAGGGSRLTPDYYARVGTAESELKRARAELAAARKGR